MKKNIHKVVCEHRTMNNQQERISLEYFKDNFQEVWSQCGRGREYVIEGDYELIEMKSIKEERTLHKPTWPPSFQPCDI
tara:strand:+ start:3010 stop:3246 length:237 start_codon:yes stop_codon:yes gene_type:complete